MKFSNVFLGYILVILVGIFSATAMADESASGEIINKCGATPPMPSIPNGMKASMDDMLAAQKKIKAFQAEAQKYRACVGQFIDQWGKQAKDPDADDDAKSAAGEKASIATNFYNQSVSDEEDVANMFNTAIHAFNGKKK